MLYLQRGELFMKKPRFFAALALVGLMAAGTAPALATCGTGSQNPSYTVMVCLSPDSVTVGQTVTLTESARNNTAAYKKVLVTETVTLPSGQQFNKSFYATLAPLKTYTFTASYQINEYFPKGAYSVTLRVADQSGASFATGMITVS
jgi:hypothetical protein